MALKNKKLTRGLLLFTGVLVLSALCLKWLQPTSQWWYPFVPSLLSDDYTTGPFAMTSNTREDNPAWSQMAAFNRTQARMTYAMSLGQPAQEVAWLLPEAEWPDKPALSFFTLEPNKNESPVSRALMAAAVDYDRISPLNLLSSSIAADTLTIGHNRYRALLISDLHSATPELLQHILALADEGIPVFWLGEMPQRAAGWADYPQRDTAVHHLNQQLRERITAPSSVHELTSALLKTLVPVLQPSNSGTMPLRVARRRLEGAHMLLLFNESDQPSEQHYSLGGDIQYAALLNPETGQSLALCKRETGNCESIGLRIPAGRTRLLYLGETAALSDQPTWNERQWQAPGRSLHPYLRWWWPGVAVDKDELRRELGSIARAGFGGVEIQTLTIGFPFQELRDHQDQIYRVGTAAFFDSLKAVFREAAQLGLAVDLTLGSGWSSGGPFIDEYPQQQLIQSYRDIQGPQSVTMDLPAPQEPRYVTPSNWVIANTIGDFDQDAELQAVIAAQLDDSTDPATLSDFVDLSAQVQGDQLVWQAPAGSYRVFAIYQNDTAHNSVASAYPGALERSPILDHLHSGGAQEYIRELGEPWLQALAPFKPAAFFVDSFELIGELPWSSGFREAFQALHGYDVTPYIPLLFKRWGESKYVNVVIPPGPRYQAPSDMVERIREDYESTRQHLFQEAFIRPLKNWTAAKDIQLRLQAHGGYGHYLDSYQMADIPESEALFAGGSFDFLKLASSAGHIAGRSVISSESFITMSLDFNRLSIDDYYFLAGNAFAAGINRTVCHGYAYHYPLAH